MPNAFASTGSSHLENGDRAAAEIHSAVVAVASHPAARRLVPATGLAAFPVSRPGSVPALAALPGSRLPAGAHPADWSSLAGPVSVASAMARSLHTRSPPPAAAGTTHIRTVPLRRRISPARALSPASSLAARFLDCHFRPEIPRLVLSLHLEKSQPGYSPHLCPSQPSSL